MQVQWALELNVDLSRLGGTWERLALSTDKEYDPTVALIHIQTMSASRTELLGLYRRLLRAALKYPSVKRTAMYSSIREGFRDGRHEKEADRITLLVEEAKQVLQVSGLYNYSWNRQKR